MEDGAGAPPSPIDGAWSHSDQPAIAGIRGDIFPGQSAPAADDPEVGLSAIKAKDARFNKDTFLGEVQKTFYLVEEAWTQQRPEMSRQVMSDNLWQQHRVQMEGYAGAGKRNVLDGLCVLSITVLAVHTDSDLDTITTRILASSADYDVDTRSSKLLRGSRNPAQWQEDWTFQRSASAHTPEAGGTLTDKCPNCGAPLDLDLTGVCKYCKAPVSSGTYDWVLARIARVPRAG